MKKFEINGRKYTPAEFDFDMMCDLEESGVSMEEIAKKPFSFVRKYFAISSGIDERIAGREINKHVENGGNLDVIMDVISEQMNNSGFFRALNKTTEAEIVKGKKETE